MILNAYTVISLFVAVLTGVITLTVSVLTIRIFKRQGKPSIEERTWIEERSYLLLLMATVVLSVRLLSLPLFYITLQSYVPYIRGAMCIFGVTQVQPLFSGIIQVYKFLVFFLIGGWLLLHRLDTASETAPLARRKLIIILVVSLLVAIEGVMDIAYFTNFNVSIDVGCCTTVFDLPDRGTAMIPASLLGEGYMRYVLPLYYISNITLILVLGLSYRRFSLNGRRDKGDSAGITKGIDVQWPGTTGIILISGLILSLINSVVTVIAFFEVIAPEIMGIPYHHCIYCMWQYSPHSILITALFVAGTFSPVWALILYLLGRHRETDKPLRRYVTSLYLLAILTLGSSLLMITANLLL